MLGPDRFRKWCMPYYNEAADILHEVGIKVVVHGDGELQGILDEIGECRIDGFESMSSPPDNTTSVADAYRMWPDRYVWANFPSSVHLREPEEIYEHAMMMLAEGGNTGRFWFQVSEDPPRHGDRWRNSGR